MLRLEVPGLPFRQFVFLRSKIQQGSEVVSAHKNSLLDWTPEPRSSWALLIEVERVFSKQTNLEVGLGQVMQLCQVRGRCDHGLGIATSDAEYGNHLRNRARFLQEAQKASQGSDENVLQLSERDLISLFPLFLRFETRLLRSK